MDKYFQSIRMGSSIVVDTETLTFKGSIMRDTKEGYKQVFVSGKAVPKWRESPKEAAVISRILEDAFDQRTKTFEDAWNLLIPDY